MIKKWILPAVVACVLIPLTYNSCSSPVEYKVSNTVAGNPMAPAMTNIVSAICSVINRCQNQVSISDCQVKVLGVGGVDYQLGLPAGSYPTISSIVQAESSKSITANSTATDTCYSQINQLDCSSSAVQGAYDTNLANPYTGAAQMLPTAPGSCPSVFVNPPGVKEYFVATTGSDANDGSSTNPWATISHASQALVVGPKGAIVHVASGTYSQTVTTAASGTGPAVRVVYISDQQWGAKITPVGSSSVWDNSGDYVEITGFEMAGDSATQSGLTNSGSHVRVVGNHIHDIPISSCFGWGIANFNDNAHDNDIVGNLIHHIGPQKPDGLPSSSYCGNASGIFHGNARGNIQNNIIYKVDRDGILAYAAATQVNISNNLVFGVGTLPSDANRMGTGILLSANSPSVVNDNSTVSNNIVRNNKGDGITTYLQVGSNNVFLNNLLISNFADFIFAGSEVAVGTITSDPLMVNFQVNGGGDYHLTSSSPAVNAGTLNCSSLTGNGNCTPSNDVTGFARPYGAVLDVGPYEWHP